MILGSQGARFPISIGHVKNMQEPCQQMADKFKTMPAQVLTQVLLLMNLDDLPPLNRLTRHQTCATKIKERRSQCLRASCTRLDCWPRKTFTEDWMTLDVCTVWICLVCLVYSCLFKRFDCHEPWEHVTLTTASIYEVWPLSKGNRVRRHLWYALKGIWEHKWKTHVGRISVEDAVNCARARTHTHSHARSWHILKESEKCKTAFCAVPLATCQNCAWWKWTLWKVPLRWLAFNVQDDPRLIKILCWA